MGFDPAANAKIPISAQQLFDVFRDNNLQGHVTVRSGRRLIFAFRDPEGKIHSYDTIVHDEVHETPTR